MGRNCFESVTYLERADRAAVIKREICILRKAFVHWLSLLIRLLLLCNPVHVVMLYGIASQFEKHILQSRARDAKVLDIELLEMIYDLSGPFRV